MQRHAIQLFNLWSFKLICKKTAKTNKLHTKKKYLEQRNQKRREKLYNLAWNEIFKGQKNQTKNCKLHIKQFHEKKDETRIKETSKKSFLMKTKRELIFARKSFFRMQKISDSFIIKMVENG